MPVPNKARGVWRILIMCAWLLFACLFHAHTAQAANSNPNQLEEYQAKALLIYNIAKFVIWPEEAFTTHPNRFVINIAGQNPFGNAFYFLDNKTIQGRDVAVESWTGLNLAYDYQVLYIDSMGLQEFSHALQSLQEHHVLVITSNVDLFDAGAMVYLGVESENLIFRVNLASAHKAGLEISGNLLRHADQVYFDSSNESGGQ